MLLALVLAAAAQAAACGQSEKRAQSQRPGSAAGEGGACAGCAGEAVAPAQGGTAAPEQGGAAASEQAGTDAGAAAGEAGAPPAPGLDLKLSRISISQTLEIPLMQAGAEVPEAMRPAPLVAGKRGLVRAFVQLAPGFEARKLIGVLDLSSPSGDDTLLSERQITQTSKQDDLESTFVFDVKARDLEPTTTYRLRVLEADTTPVLRFPESGVLPLVAKQREPLKLVLVPMLVGSLAPLTGQAELRALRARLTALFPSTSVETSLAPPVTLNYAMDGDGAGWDDALEDLYALREQAMPPHDVFYYGMLAPSTSFDDYCTGTSCIVGYSNVAIASDEDSRGSIGVTVFPDGSGADEAWDTLAHELGHAMGRKHSPCDVDGPTDRTFPYPAGDLGMVYGFDFDEMKLIRPTLFYDIMGYCAPFWTSDYTYRALFERLDYIAGESFRALAWLPTPPELFRVARVALDGRSTWRGERRRSTSPGESRTVDLLDAAAQRIGSIDARFVARDHSRGGLVWFAARGLAQSGAAAVDLRAFGGSVLPL